jgi:hypothetical protein
MLLARPNGGITTLWLGKDEGGRQSLSVKLKHLFIARKNDES